MPSRRRLAAGAARQADVEHVLHQDAVAQLEALHASLPQLTGKGQSACSCSRHVDASDVARARIDAAGVDLDPPTTDGSCPHD